MIKPKLSKSVTGAGAQSSCEKQCSSTQEHGRHATTVHDARAELRACSKRNSSFNSKTAEYSAENSSNAVLESVAECVIGALAVALIDSNWGRCWDTTGCLYRGQSNAHPGPILMHLSYHTEPSVWTCSHHNIYSSIKSTTASCSTTVVAGCDGVEGTEVMDRLSRLICTTCVLEVVA